MCQCWCGCGGCSKPLPLSEGLPRHRASSPACFSTRQTLAGLSARLGVRDAPKGSTLVAVLATCGLSSWIPHYRVSAQAEQTFQRQTAHASDLPGAPWAVSNDSNALRGIVIWPVRFLYSIRRALRNSVRRVQRSVPLDIALDKTQTRVLIC